MVAAELSPGEDGQGGSEAECEPGRNSSPGIAAGEGLGAAQGPGHPRLGWRIAVIPSPAKESCTLRAVVRTGCC